MHADQEDHMKGKSSTKEVNNMCKNLTKLVKEEFPHKKIAGEDYNQEAY